MQEDISNKTGENIYRRAKLSLDEVTFNGNTGIFYEREKDAEKDEKTGKYPKKAISETGGTINVVFLKIRRVLSSFSKKGSLRTSEHNHKGEMAVLYGPSGLKEPGIASELREKYPQLKTQQIVYCYRPGFNKIVRIVIKGSSLGSEYKHLAEVLKFYDYLQSFSSNEHSHEFVTQLTPVKEEGPQGDYYAISFVKGQKLGEEELKKVELMINEIHEKTSEIDSRFQGNIKKPKEVKNELPTIDANEIPVIEDDDKEDEDDGEMPESVKFPDDKQDNINVKDIPF